MNKVGALLCFLFLSAPRGTLASEAKRAVTFAVLGDVHLGLRGADHGFKMTASSEKLFQIAIDQLNAMPDLSFVVFAGDLVPDAESFNLARFKEMADELKVPYYVVFGNHDQPTIPSAEAWSAPVAPSPLAGKPGARAFYPGETKASIATLFSGHGFSQTGQTWWSADLAGIHLVGLDSTQIKTWGGVIPAREMAWLKRDLAAHAQPTLVFMHHNLIESYPEYGFWSNFLVSNREEVKSLIRPFPQVKAVISAHYHFSDYHAESGVHYFTTPSINTYPCRFAVFELTPNSLRMRTHSLVQPDEHHDEAEAVQRRAKEELPKAQDWTDSIAKGLKKMGKSDEAAAVAARLWEIFEANSSSPELALRAAR